MFINVWMVNKLSLKNIFPQHKFNNTVEEQLSKVLEELVEAEQDMLNNNKEHMAEELIDVMNATANCLYKLGFNDTYIENKIRYVKHKNEVRGYYDGVKPYER